MTPAFGHIVVVFRTENNNNNDDDDDDNYRRHESDPQARRWVDATFAADERSHGVDPRRGGTTAVVGSAFAIASRVTADADADATGDRSGSLPRGPHHPRHNHRHKHKHEHSKKKLKRTRTRTRTMCWFLVRLGFLGVYEYYLYRTTTFLTKDHNHNHNHNHNHRDNRDRDGERNRTHLDPDHRRPVEATAGLRQQQQQQQQQQQLPRSRVAVAVAPKSEPKSKWFPQTPPATLEQYPTGECAINLFGLPRSFRHHVLPSLVNNVLKPNRRYRCDWFVHFFNEHREETEANNNFTRGGNRGGILTPEDVYLLREAVRNEYEYEHNNTNNNDYVYESSGSSAERQRPTDAITASPPTIRFVADTNQEFASQRREYITEILTGAGNGDDTDTNANANNNNNNPYVIKEASFTNRTLLNILKMWHSIDRVWNLMENEQQHAQQHENQRKRKRYRRVAMLRLDVIYVTPIDVYKIPKVPIPEDYNDAYLNELRRPSRQKQKEKIQKNPYFHAWEDPDQEYCVLPGFKSFPVNDRYVAGPYEAVEIWARDRFARARDHVTRVLPELEKERLKKQLAAPSSGGSGSGTDPFPLTDFGLHDERFVAHTILPAIRKLPSNSNSNNVASPKPIGIQVDRGLYFVRVRADGSIWLRDKPGYGRVRTLMLEEALGRKCTGEPYQVEDGILGEKSPGLWQIKCPPLPVAGAGD
eukprot:jgi/Psemu1/47829/gm1.47829_g